MTDQEKYEKRYGVGAYAPKALTESMKGELINLYHTGISVTGKRYEGMLYAAKHFHREHPEFSSTKAYLELEKLIHQNPAWTPPFAKRKRKRLGVLYHKAFAKFSKENPKQIDPDKYWYGKGFDDALLGIRKRNKIKAYLKGYRDGIHYAETRMKHGFDDPRPTKNNPRGVLIYGRVLKIFAQKTSGPYRGQQFVHTFKRGAIMVGMPDGSLRIMHS